MKHAIFFGVMILCLIFAGETYAQRALPAMHGVEIRGGMVDGWYSAAGRSSTGYYFGAAMSRYARNANKWGFGVEYLLRNYPYKTGCIPIAQFTGEGGYYYKFLTDGSKTIFCYLGGVALAGYEIVNWGEKKLYDGAAIRNQNRFLYGGAVILEVEIFLTDRFILSVSGRERILWGTTTGHFHTQFGVALRLMID